MRDAKSETKRHKATEQNDATTTATPTWPRESEILNKHETDWLFCWQIFRCIDSGSFFFRGVQARALRSQNVWDFYLVFFFVSLFRLRRALAPAPFKKSPPESIHRNSLFIFSFFVCLLCLSRSKQVGSFYSKGFQTLTSWPLFSSYVCFIKVDITREVYFFDDFVFLLSNINLWDIVCLL